MFALRESAFPFYQRKEPGPGDRFRFLFNGNIRDSTKGFGLAISAWRTWLASGRMPPGTQFYVKTTGLPGPELSFYTALNGNLVGPYPLPADVSPDLPEIAILVDSRNLSIGELVALYNSSHVLLAPSLGEAWNLVLTEAMSTGMPCAWTHATSTLDYADTSTGWPITAFKPCIFRQDMPGYYGFAAEESAIINAMQEIVDDYSAALARGKAASTKMASYTWGMAAEKFCAICRRYI
jgi:glycosyltransferase involved in cell wall biosynthesis